MRIILFTGPDRRRWAMVAVQAAVCLTALLTVVAIALDVGIMLAEQRHGQAAADAAAMAGAVDLYKHYQTNNGSDSQGTAAASALATASANGYSNDGTTSIVTVNIPPKNGYFVGKTGYVEVIVQYNQQRGFSAILGSGNIPVTARAVARGMWTAFNDGIIVLDPMKKGSLDATGNAGATVVGANIIVDSNNAAGGLATGNGSLGAPQFDLSGVPGYSTTGNAQFIGTMNSGVQPTPDPLAYLPEPDPSTLAVQSTSKLQISGQQSVTLNPGVYTGGISISGQANVTLNPGIYYLQGGGFSWSGQGNLTGSGVLLYNAPASSSDTISITGQGNVNITPMTTGIYQGISIFQDRTSTAPVSVTGNGNMNISGTFYAAAATLNITGNGNANVIGSQYVSYDLVLTGNGNININWDANHTGRTRLIGLVE